MWIFRRRNPHRVNRGFRLSQTFSAAALALGHGLQDAQKTMGVIFLALITAGYLPTTNDDLPLWVIVSAATRDLAGHVLRRLAHHAHAGPPDHPPRPAARLRRRVRRRRPSSTSRPSSAQAPVSTTHTITSAVMGAGATKRLSAVRWGVARQHRDRLGADLPGRRARRRAGLTGSCAACSGCPEPAGDAGPCPPPWQGTDRPMLPRGPSMRMRRAGPGYDASARFRGRSAAGLSRSGRRCRPRWPSPRGC